jgi:hypothetical protein
MPHRLVLAVVVLGACSSNTISGTIDGESVSSARSAIFDEVELDLGILGEYRVFQLLVTDIPDACAFYDRLTLVEPSLDCDATCIEYAGIADEYLGADDYYTLSMNIRSDVLVEDTYDYDAGVDGNDTFSASYTAYDVAVISDANLCEDACEEADPLLGQDADAGQSGLVELTHRVEYAQLVGSYEVGFGGEDTVKGKFDAEFCDMGDWIWWL